MTRLPPLRPRDLNPAQRSLYDAITTGPRGTNSSLTNPDGVLGGPFNAMLYAPQIGMALQELGAAIRFRSSLEPREREIATLTVAHHHQSEFEWYAHAAIARSIGMTETELEALTTGNLGASFSPREQTIYALVVTLVTTGDLDDAGYADAVGELGEETLVTITALIGLYSMLALQMRLFRVPIPTA